MQVIFRVYSVFLTRIASYHKLCVVGVFPRVFCEGGSQTLHQGLSVGEDEEKVQNSKRYLFKTSKKFICYFQNLQTQINECLGKSSVEHQQN